MLAIAPDNDPVAGAYVVARFGLHQDNILAGTMQSDVGPPLVGEPFFQ
jgi:hypothetical protein